MIKLNHIELGILRRLLAGRPLIGCVDRPEDRARQRLRRKGLIMFIGGCWIVTDAGRQFWHELFPRDTPA